MSSGVQLSGNEMLNKKVSRYKVRQSKNPAEGFEIWYLPSVVRNRAIPLRYVGDRFQFTAEWITLWPDPLRRVALTTTVRTDLVTIRIRTLPISLISGVSTLFSPWSDWPTSIRVTSLLL